MRHILCNYARDRLRKKRGGDLHRLSLEDIEAIPRERSSSRDEQSAMLVALDEALAAPRGSGQGPERSRRMPGLRGHVDRGHRHGSRFIAGHGETPLDARAFMALSRDPSRSGGLTRWIHGFDSIPKSWSAMLDQALSLPPSARGGVPGRRSAGTISCCARSSALSSIAHDASSGYFERLSEQIVNPALVALSDYVGDEPVVGQTFAQYRILEKLAAGGMGVVFKALDQRLERFVALKFLPSPLSADGGLQRASPR